MAQDNNLPCDGDGICMICKKKPTDGETLTCKTCVTLWHITCLSTPPQTLADAVHWECPDCSVVSDPIASGEAAAFPTGSESAGNLITAIRAIESDQSLTEQEKAKRRQELMSGCAKSTAVFAVDGDYALS